MSATSDFDVQVNEALDAYIKYFEYDGNDVDDSEELRFAFIDAAVEVLEKLTGRNVNDELDL